MPGSRSRCPPADERAGRGVGAFLRHALRPRGALREAGRGGTGRGEARRGARAAKVCARAPPPLRPRRAGPSRAAPSPAGSATGGMRRRQVREGGEPRGEGGEGGSARRDGAGLGAAELRAPLGSSPRACRSIAARSRRSVAAGRDRAFGFGPRGPPTPCRAEARSVRGTPAFLPPFPVPPFCYDRDAGLSDALKVRERRTKRRGAPRVGAAARGPAARLRAAGGRPGDRPRRWGRCGPAGAARGTGRTGRCCWEPPRASAAFLFVPAGPLSPAEGSGSQRSPWFCGSVEGLGEAERREPGGGLSRHGTDNSLEPVVVPG